MNERLGPVVAIHQTMVSTKRMFSGTLTETVADVQFENGSATSKLSTMNDRLIEFDVPTEQLDDAGFTGPAVTWRYQELVADLIKTITANAADAALRPLPSGRP